ncbi:MAG: CRTAC1 family protein [Planctomycetota bacterium]|nr:CRTAC1 family protein [Planctomycetota bacterium]
MTSKLSTRLCVSMIVVALKLGLNASAVSQEWFSDASTSSGIQFQHTTGSKGQYYVVEPFGSGMAIFDFDGDGFEDIYFLNGRTLPEEGTEWFEPVTDDSPRNVLYRNNGNFTFADVSQESGLDDAGYGLGVVCGDVDNDGDVDVYVSNFGPNRLYINHGDGTFSEASEWAGVDGGREFGAGVVMFDMEGDGDLDLYAANYQQFTFKDHMKRFIGKYQFHPGPLDYPPQPDRLYRNDGEGKFTDVSESSGVSAVAGTGMGVIAADIDLDGDCDILVANDTKPNFVLLNDGTGDFTEQAILSGMALDGNGKANGNMGIELRDLDGDGLLDCFTTTYQDEMPILYLNFGGGAFADDTNRARIDRKLFAHVHWGVGLVDFDNDSLTDIFVACGHFMDNIVAVRDTTQVKIENYLLHNQGAMRFAKIEGDEAGVLSTRASSRAAAFSDLDNDGDVDIIVMNAQDHPTVMRSLVKDSIATENHWIMLRLIGNNSNRDAAGATVTLKRPENLDVQQTAAVHLGRGYQSHYGSRLHFGLGKSESPVQVSVNWPSGVNSTHVISDLDQVHILREEASNE